MKRWWNIVAVGGFLIVLAFVVRRLSEVPASWFYLNGELKSDLVSLGLGCAAVAAVSLAILWGGDLVWKRIRQKQPNSVIAGPQHSFAGRWPDAARVGVFSLALGIAAQSLAGVRTPGTLALRLIFPVDVHGSTVAGFLMILLFVMPIVVDSAICFAILWGGYRLWMRSRQGRTP